MCLFPLPNLNFNGLAYRKGVREFDCGACPECLRKRANLHALTSVYEARSHVHNCMITLTYDNFMRDDKGNFVLDSRGNKIENPVDPDLKVNVRDVQLFVKRLRKYISYHYPNNEKIKYRISAEYGSRTHRAHYHAIIFGFDFPDRFYYKKSKRGNVIYMSNILTKLWSHGICTVDSINVHSAVARYCSKYCAKSRSDKTFTVSSQRIGVNELLKDFNGRNYMIDGREYPVPRVVWQDVIMSRYKDIVPDMDCRYVNKPFGSDDFSLDYSAYDKGVFARSLYRAVRDSDPQYSSYLSYWQRRGVEFDQHRLSPIQRIYLLDDQKYHFYKIAALQCSFYRNAHIPVIAPGSNCISAYYRYLFAIHRKLGLIYNPCTCPLSSRLNKASDTIKPKILLEEIFDVPPRSFFGKNIQLSLDI